MSKTTDKLSSPPANKMTKKSSSPLSKKKTAPKLSSGFSRSSDVKIGYVMVPIRADLVVEVCRWQSIQPAIREPRKFSKPPVAGASVVAPPSVPVVKKVWKVKESVVPEVDADRKSSLRAEKRQARNRARRSAWRARRAQKAKTVVGQAVTSVPESVPPVSTDVEAKIPPVSDNDRTTAKASLLRPRSQRGFTRVSDYLKKKVSDESHDESQTPEIVSDSWLAQGLHDDDDNLTFLRGEVARIRKIKDKDLQTSERQRFLEFATKFKEALSAEAATRGHSAS